ncbi:hypothetical protein CEW89_03930 [Celeribacter ethanolicus]|uniref:Uncharacterized protein n=1 Tax=Celeribacter ethanolicus TaxID=1758178 RepID=A0A291G9R0_9RHOB|nr:hypothetical protein CEW89_03930 [Celeribacter ethanolicus]
MQRQVIDLGNAPLSEGVAAMDQIALSLLLSSSRLRSPGATVRTGTIGHIAMPAIRAKSLLPAIAGTRAWLSLQMDVLAIRAGVGQNDRRQQGMKT